MQNGPRGHSCRDATYRGSPVLCDPLPDQQATLDFPELDLSVRLRATLVKKSLSIPKNEPIRTHNPKRTMTAFGKRQAKVVPCALKQANLALRLDVA